MLMVAQGMGVASRACVRTANRETHGSYASCACTGRLGGAERGGYQPNEVTMAASPLSPSLVCLFILISGAVRCKRIFATGCERHLKATKRASGSGDHIHCEGKVPEQQAARPCKEEDTVFLFEPIRS